MMEATHGVPCFTGGIRAVPPEIRLHGLTVCHDRQAVHQVSGHFAPGSLTAVVGPNGAGKSTLLRSLAGLHPPTEGRVEAVGAAPRVALLPQAAAIDRTFPIACLDVALLGLWHEQGAFGAVPADGRHRAERALAAVGLSGFEGRLVGSLSAGQFQRLIFARMLLTDAAVILLDEPFSAIDARTAADLLDVVRRWHGEGRTVVAVLHDLDLVRREFPETLLLSRDCLGWGPTAAVLAAGHHVLGRRTGVSWGFGDAKLWAA